MNTGTTAPILVTGGTGTLGRLAVAQLAGAGHDVRVLSRGEHAPGDHVEYVAGDLDTGAGIDAAVQGTEVILHLAGSSKGDEVKARHLVQAAARARTQHLVNISVVGADRVPLPGRVDRALFGYFGSQLAAEQVIAESGVPWTSLRATQFHQLMFKVAQGMTKLPVVPVPSRSRFQPIEAAEVAGRLVELVRSDPAGQVAEMGGPQVRDLADLVRAYLAAAGKHRLLVPVRIPGAASRAVRHGATLTPDHAVGHRTWEQFLAAEVGAPHDPSPAAA